MGGGTASKWGVNSYRRRTQRKRKLSHKRSIGRVQRDRQPSREERGGDGRNQRVLSNI